MPAEPANTDALPGAPADHAGANCVDNAGDLVPRDARECEAGPLSFDGETVAVAHTAGLDAHADLASRRLGHVALDKFKRAPARVACTARILAIVASFKSSAACRSPVPGSKRRAGAFRRLGHC